MTARELGELRLIEEGMVFDQEQEKVTFSYPYIKDPCVLQDNLKQVKAIETRVEARLEKQGRRAEYDEEVKAYLERKTFVELSQQELEDYKGPVNYIAHHEVMKPGSVSTKLRIVSNSSLNNNNTGVSFNDLVAKGPNSLIPLLEVATSWRQYPRVCVWDYKKCYNSVFTTEKEKHLRRFVWRFEGETEWRVFAIDRMHFGDKPAAIGLDVAKKLVAEAGRDIDEAAVEMIKRDYVDDGVGGGNEEDVDRLMGEKVDSDGRITYDGTVPRIMRKGGFQIKIMIKDCEKRQEVLEEFGGKVLGMPWDTTEDVIAMHPIINLSRKMQKIRTGPDISPETIDLINEAKLTKRILTSQIYGIYDPLGLLAPITIRYKMILQELDLRKLAWDDEIPDDLDKVARDALREIVMAGCIKFPRALMKESADKSDIVLVLFTDGGDPAACAVIYHRTKDSITNDYDVRLMAGKARVNPSSAAAGKTRRTTPRSEMRGFLIGVRLVSSLLPGLPYKPRMIFPVSDSECIISCLEAQDRVLESWFSNRVAEANDHMDRWRQQGIEVPSVHHWPGSQNVADLGTKGKAKLEDVGPGSRWQTGPAELRLDITQWPASRDFRQNLPQDELKVKPAQPKIANNLKVKEPNLRFLEVVKNVLDCSNNYNKCLNIMARVMRASAGGDIRQKLTVEDLDKAEMMIRICASYEAAPEIAKKCGSMDPFLTHGVWYTQGRLRKQMIPIFGVSKLQLLLPNQRLAELWMTKAHNVNHDAAKGTLLRSRNLAWIHRGRFLADKVVKECTACRIKLAKMVCQKMGQISLNRTMLDTPPWLHIALDFVGPLKCKDMVNKRKELKVWGIVFACLGTGAIAIKIAHNYSTEAFLIQFGSFVDTRGAPETVISDKGSQLTSKENVVAMEEQDQGPANYDWDKIATESLVSRTRWEFVPAGSQWRNGLVERRISSLKHTIAMVLLSELKMKKSTLDYAELQAFMDRIANIVNDRPIGLNSATTDELTPLTPNHLLLGRNSSTRISYNEQGELNDCHTMREYIDHITKAWWEMWKHQVVEQLMPYRSKEVKVERNMEVGDVCLLKYDSKVENHYRLCVVREIIPSSESGIVRTVIVAMNNRQAKGKKFLPASTLEVGVQRLSLIVPVEEQTEAEQGLTKLFLQDDKEEKHLETTDTNVIPEDLVTRLKEKEGKQSVKKGILERRCYVKPSEQK